MDRRFKLGFELYGSLVQAPALDDVLACHLLNDRRFEFFIVARFRRQTQ